MNIGIEPVPTASVGAAWPVLEAMLAPAIQYNPNPGASLADVLQRLTTGQCEAAFVTAPGVRGVIVTELCVLDGVKCCWASYVGGSVDASPKLWIKTMRALMARFEDLAREAGCEEMRIGGRDWSRVLPDYERFDDVPNRLRKVL